MIGPAVRRPAGRGGARRVVLRAGAVVLAVVPVVAPFPDVARHVVQAVAVRPVGRLVRLPPAGPVEIGFAVQLAVVEADRRRPRQRPRLVRIAGSRPVGPGQVGLVAPREQAVRPVTAAASGVLPLGLRGQAEALLREVALPRDRVVEGLVALLLAQPVTVRCRPAPPDAHRGMVLLALGHGELAPFPQDPAGRVGPVGIAVDVLRAGSEDPALLHLDPLLREGRIEELAVLPVGHLGGGDIERVDADGVDRQLIAAVLSAAGAVMIAHLKRPAGNRHEPRHGGLGDGSSACGASRLPLVSSGPLRRSAAAISAFPSPLAAPAFGWTHLLAAELAVAVLVELLEHGRRAPNLLGRQLPVAVGIDGGDHRVPRPT